MTGNATFRHRDVALLAVVGIEAPVVVPSTVFDERLAPTLKRLRLPKGLLSPRRRRPRAPVVGRQDDVRRRRHRRGCQGAGRGRHRRRRRRAADQHLGDADVPRALRRLADPLGPGPAVERPRLRPDQRVPRVRQRHDARRPAHRLRPGQYAVIVNGEDPRPTQEATIERLSQPGLDARAVPRGVRDADARCRRGGRGPRPGPPAPRRAPAARRDRPRRRRSTTSCASAASTG